MIRGGCLMKFFRREKDYSFYFYAIFVSLLVFLLSLSAYGGFWVPFILAFFVQVFLRFTKFIFDLILKGFGLIRDSRNT